MTDRQSNRLAMLRTTLQVLDDHPEAWGSLPVVRRYRNELAAYVEAARGAVRQQADPTTAVTAVKNELRAEVEAAVAGLARALQAWAEDAGRPDVAAQAGVTPSDLRNARDADLAEDSERIVALAREHAEALAPYGVTADEVGALDTLDDDFADALGTPRAAIAAASRAGTRISEALGGARTLLARRLDPMVARLQQTAPDFAAEYRQARRIVDRRGPSTDPDPAPDA